MPEYDAGDNDGGDNGDGDNGDRWFSVCDEIFLIWKDNGRTLIILFIANTLT
jgi:hypothetical protein